MKNPCIYIMAPRKNGTIYTGVTSDLMKRVWEHKNNVFKGFTSQYSVRRLVYFDDVGDMQSAFNREKQIKGWLRKKKIALIESMNPEWNDLSEGWYA